MDPRVVPRRPRGSADPVPPAERAAGATPSPQLGARLSARKGSTSERCSARARCCTALTAMSTASRPLAVQLGEFVAGLRFENLPPAVVDKAKAVVNHAVTVGMAGAGHNPRGSDHLPTHPRAPPLPPGPAPPQRRSPTRPAPPTPPG